MNITLAHHWYRRAYPSGENGVVEGVCARAVAWTQLSQRELFTRAEDYLSPPILGGIAAGMHCLDLVPGRHRARLYAAVAAAEVVHLHNPWPGLGLGLFRAARDVGRPLVWTLHNYRLFSTNEHILVRRDGTYRLVRPDTPQQVQHHVAMTGFRFTLLQNHVHNFALLRLWNSGVLQAAVKQFICLNRVQERMLLELGIPRERISLGANYADISGVIADRHDGAVFVGRLNHEKGIDFFLRSWNASLPPLRCVGDGPMLEQVRAAADRNIIAVGAVPRDEARRHIASANFLVMASTSYEVQPLVIVEALSQGIPCLVPAFGGMADMIQDGVTGLWYRPGDTAHFQEQARRLTEQAGSMRTACLEQARARYSHKVEEATLRGIYERAVGA